MPAKVLGHNPNRVQRMTRQRIGKPARNGNGELEETFIRE
jgi:hypothetical protein